MDPSANLEEQRQLIKEIRDADRRCDDGFVMHCTARLCDLVEALDEWICNGGFLPKYWNR